MNFPDCNVLTMPQRSDEWFQVRKGVLAASEMGPWLINSDKRSKTTWRKMIAKLVAQTAGAWEPPVFETEAMRRGTEYEPQAIESFEKATGQKVTDVGFCRSNLGRFGCSPDGLIESDLSGIESKVPIPSTHVYYRREGALPDEYKFQVLGSMAVTGASSWWFQCWNPALVPFRLKVERNAEVETLKQALIEFSKQLETALQEEKFLWSQTFKSIK